MGVVLNALALRTGVGTAADTLARAAYGAALKKEVAGERVARRKRVVEAIADGQRVIRRSEAEGEL